MTIQYYMRGYNTVANLPGAPIGYVDWVVNDQPDSTAQFVTQVSSQYIPANIINITVNKVVTSKVNNFINPAAEPSFISPNYPNPLDGYYLHVSSFDWLNPTPPTAGVPSEPTGLAVVRGYSSGNLNPYSTLSWIESDGYWSFNQLLANGSLGPVQNVNMGSLGTNGPLTVIDGYIGVSETSYVGDPWAASGIIRIPNNQYVKSNNAAHNADVNLIGADTSNRVVLGSSGTTEVYIPQYLRVDQAIVDANEYTSTAVAQSGFIRLPNAATANAFRNLAQTADLAGVGSTAGNLITLGDANNSGVQIKVGVGTPISINHVANGNDLLDFVFYTSASGIFPALATSISFNSAAQIPTITQATTSSAGAQNLFSIAQTTTAVSGLGGANIVRSGHGPGADGYVDLGSIGQTLPMIRIFPNSGQNQANSPSDYRPYGTSFQANSASMIVFDPVVRFPQTITTLPASNLFGNGGNTGALVSGPVIGQDDAAVGSGYPMIISAQWTSAVAAGGSLTVTGGSSTGSGGTGGAAKFSGGNANTGGVATGGATTVGGGNANGSAASLGGLTTIFGGNATTGTTTTATTSAGLARAGGNIVLSPGVGFGASGTQTHGEVDWQNAGATVGRFYADSFVPYAEIGSNTTNNPSWHPASVGFIRLAHLPTDGYTSVGYTAVAMRNSANTNDILLVGSDQFNNVVVGDGFHNVIIGGNALNTDVAPSGTNTYIAGNLIVLGTTTTVDSTVVDIVGRVIHGNWPENPGSAPPALAPPTLIAGFDINRGYSVSNVMNDGAAIIWTEGVQTVSGSDGYWRFATISQDGYNTSPRDNYTIASSPNALSVMASSFSAVSNSVMNLTGAQLISQNPLPGVGALRTLNATVAVSARNAASTQDLFLIGTDGLNHIILGETPTPYNAGFQLYTTTGSYADFFTNNVSQVQIGSDANGPFVRESSTTYTPAQNGFVRVPLGITAVAARNGSNLADILLLGTNLNNQILHGDSTSPTNGGHIFSTTTNSIFDFWVNGISQVSIGANEINFTNTDGYSTIQQSPTYINSTTGATLTVAAQSALGTLTIGGNLNLTSGLGTLVDGYLNLQVAGANVVGVEPADTLGHSKFVFFQGRRRHITQVTGTYSVVPSDDYIAITALSSPLTIFLPAFPILGDAYEIKDTTGNAGTSPVTISGNGTNIDATSTFILSQPYASAVFTYTGTTWSIT